jgi:hypothetical protein
MTRKMTNNVIEIDSYVFTSKLEDSDILRLEICELCYETLPCMHNTNIILRLGYIEQRFIRFYIDN